MFNSRKLIIPSIAFAMLIFIQSCEITEPTDGLEVRLNTFSRETLVSGYLYDANTLEPVSENITVEFIGENSSKIVDETNEQQSSFTVKNGLFIFGIEDGTEFSRNSPLSFNVIIQGGNYESELQRIEIKQKGNQTRNFYLSDPSNLPSDSDSETFNEGTTDNSGTLNQPMELTTSQGNSVSISSGTTLKDANGSPVIGDLTSRLTIVPLTTENSYNAPSSINTSSGAAVNPLVKFNFNVTDQSGNSVDNFSNDVHFSINLPTDFDLPISSGETISVWKQNSNTGNWGKVGEASLSSLLLTGKSFNSISEGSLNGTTNEAGNLLLGNENDVCDAFLTISNYPDDFSAALQFFDNEGKLLTTSNSSEVDFQIPVEGMTIGTVRINAELSDPFNTGIELGNNISLVCDQNSANLNFPNNLLGVELQIIGICTAEDPVVVVNPNVSFSYRKEGTSTWQSGNLVNGFATVTGLELATYEVSATYRGKSGNAKFEIIDETNINIIEVSNPENLLSVDVDPSLSPPRVTLEIDIEDECS